MKKNKASAAYIHGILFYSILGGDQSKWGNLKTGLIEGLGYIVIYVHRDKMI